MACLRRVPNLWLVFGLTASAIGFALVCASAVDAFLAVDPAPPVALTLAPAAAASQRDEPAPGLQIADASNMQRIARRSLPLPPFPRHGAPSTSATDPWVSPLYPQNGVTLWDRVRVSTKRDRRAFLLGTAIQLHAPPMAATPGPRYGEGRHPGGASQTTSDQLTQHQPDHELPISTPATKTNAPPTMT